jgi:hypothetical protein
MLPRNLSREKLIPTPAGALLPLRNPFVSNILRANPSFAIFYPDSEQILAANSRLLNDLQAQSVFFLIRICQPKAHSRKSGEQ